MSYLPPLGQILDHAYRTPPRQGSATTATTADAAGTTPERHNVSPSPALAALLEMADPIDPAYIRGTEQQRQQDFRNRARVDLVLARLNAGEGVAPFNPHDPSGQHFCFRDQNGVLSIGSHAAFMAGHEPTFVLHMHGPGLMARQDGAWIENPDAAFFEALDAASRSSQQAFIV